jgi:hypothetical protein
MFISTSDYNQFFFRDIDAWFFLNGLSVIDSCMSANPIMYVPQVHTVRMQFITAQNGCRCKEG